MTKYTTFTPEEAAKHRHAMMMADFKVKADAMRYHGATEEEVNKVMKRALEFKNTAPFMRWISDKLKGKTPDWMDQY